MNIDDKILIFYHKDDNDGVFSAAIFKNYLMYELLCESEDIICVGIDHGYIEKIDKSYIDELHEVYSTLIITDISLKPDVMNYVYKVFGNNFIWIDHHKPIIKECEKYKASSYWKGERGTDRSSILLAYRYCYDPFDEKYNSKKIPELFRVLSAWDSFTFEQEGYDLEYVRAVNEGINQIYNLDLAKVLQTFSQNTDNILVSAHNIGQQILQYKKQYDADLIRHSGDKEWTIGEDNRKACMLVCQGPSSSRTFESLYNTNIKSGIVFKYRPQHNDWVISLYNIDFNDESFHCGEYMKKHYKGGGHCGAAGGNVTQKQFEKILKNKHL